MSTPGRDAPVRGDTAARRADFRRMITVYGRNPVLEALGDPALEFHALHLARSNRKGGIIADIRQRAEALGLQTIEHSREELSRVSRNGRQDQGVALDVRCPRIRELEDYLGGSVDGPQRLLALDGVTNPQNLGMALRSAVAGGIDGILYAQRGNPALGPLVIKASSGTVFRAPLLRCSTIAQGVEAALHAGFRLYRLQAGASRSLLTAPTEARALFVLGGETGGLSDGVKRLPGEDLAIPMAAGVESLNVAVSAALVAYMAGQRER